DAEGEVVRRWRHLGDRDARSDGNEFLGRGDRSRWKGGQEHGPRERELGRRLLIPNASLWLLVCRKCLLHSESPEKANNKGMSRYRLITVLMLAPLRRAI